MTMPKDNQRHPSPITIDTPRSSPAIRPLDPENQSISDVCSSLTIDSPKIPDSLQDPSENTDIDINREVTITATPARTIKRLQDRDSGETVTPPLHTPAANVSVSRPVDNALSQIQKSSQEQPKLPPKNSTLSNNEISETSDNENPVKVESSSNSSEAGKNGKKNDTLSPEKIQTGTNSQSSSSSVSNSPQPSLEAAPFAATTTKSNASFIKDSVQNIVAENGIPVCKNCKTSTTPLWRRDEQGNVLCNACGLFLKLHARNRPISLKTDTIKSRNRVKHHHNHPNDKQRQQQQQQQQQQQALQQAPPEMNLDEVRKLITVVDAGVVPSRKRRDGQTLKFSPNTPSTSTMVSGAMINKTIQPFTLPQPQPTIQMVPINIGLPQQVLPFTEAQPNSFIVNAQGVLPIHPAQMVNCRSGSQTPQNGLGDHSLSALSYAVQQQQQLQEQQQHIQQQRNIQSQSDQSQQAKIHQEQLHTLPTPTTTGNTFQSPKLKKITSPLTLNGESGNNSQEYGRQNEESQPQHPPSSGPGTVLESLTAYQEQSYQQYQVSSKAHLTPLLPANSGKHLPSISSASSVHSPALLSTRSPGLPPISVMGQHHMHGIVSSPSFGPQFSLNSAQQASQFQSQSSATKTPVTTQPLKSAQTVDSPSRSVDMERNHSGTGRTKVRSHSNTNTNTNTSISTDTNADTTENSNEKKLLEQITKLKTRVFELELVNDLYRTKITELEALESGAKRRELVMRKRLEDLSLLPKELASYDSSDNIPLYNYEIRERESLNKNSNNSISRRINRDIEERSSTSSSGIGSVRTSDGFEDLNSSKKIRR